MEAFAELCACESIHLALSVPDTHSSFPEKLSNENLASAILTSDIFKLLSDKSGVGTIYVLHAFSAIRTVFFRGRHASVASHAYALIFCTIRWFCTLPNPDVTQEGIEVRTFA